MEPNSEAELKELLDEGKITEEEYRQLLAAIGQTKKPPAGQRPGPGPAAAAAPAKPRTGFGKAALILFIVSILLPLSVVILNILTGVSGASWSRMKFIVVIPVVLMGVVSAALAFIFGIIGWKSAAGKIAAIGVPVFGAMSVFLILPVMFFSLRAAHVSPVLLESNKAYPLDSLEGVLTQEGLQFDAGVSSDGRGALKVTQEQAGKTVYRLFETGPIAIDNRMLIYQAHVKSDLSAGQAYLDMWCNIEGREYFSRGLAQPVSGTMDWTSVQTPFRLEQGQTPANVKLNLVIEGAGTVWIDDIKLLSSPLN